MYSNFLSNYPFEQRDLTNAEQNSSVLAIASELLDDKKLDVIKLEKELCQNDVFVSQASPIFLEALSIASSKVLLSQCKTPVHVTIVWAMYGETDRMKTKGEHPHGEDALRVKIAQLNWLFESTEKNHSWSIIMCDDGCPQIPSSSQFATQIASQEGFNEQVNIIKLQDAIDYKTSVNPYFSKITSTSDSRKGGSILLGLWHAVHKESNNERPDREHVIVFSDGDLSANLGQIGKLVHPIINQNKCCAVGQRYGINGSILVKESGAMTEPKSTGSKPDKVIILFRHFARVSLIPSLSSVLDTQAGFKAFDARLLEKVIPEIQSFKELFDIELLIKTTQHAGIDALSAIPIVFTEDFALTNFPSIEPGEGHLNMINQIIDIYEQHVSTHTPADPGIIAFLKDLNLERYVKLIERLKSEDADDPTLFDRRWNLEQLKDAILEPASL